MNMNDKLELSQVRSEISRLYAQINILKKQEAALIRGRDVCQRANGAHPSYHTGKNNYKKENVVRRCGIVATPVSGSVNEKEISLDTVISGDVDDKFLDVDNVVKNPDTAEMFCFHLPIKMDGLRHPMTTDIKHYIDHFLPYLMVNKPTFYSSEMDAFQCLADMVDHLKSRHIEGKILELFKKTDSIHAERVQAMFAMAYLWTVNGNLMCAKHATRVIYRNNKFTYTDEMLWSDCADEGCDREREMAGCRFCIIQRFYTIIFNLWKPVLLIDSDDHVIEYLQQHLKDVDRAPVYYNVLFRTATIHLVRMLLDLELKDMNDKDIITFMKKIKFVSKEVKSSPTPDKTTKILTLLATKIDGSPLELSSVNYSVKTGNAAQSGNKTKKLVLLPKKGDFDPKHTLEIMYLVYPEIFYRLNVTNVRLVKCDVKKRNLMNFDSILSYITVNEYVKTTFAIQENVIFTSKYIPHDESDTKIVDVIVSVRAKDKEGGYTIKDANDRFVVIEDHLSKLAMNKTDYKSIIRPCQDAESRTRYTFEARDRIKIGQLHKNMGGLANIGILRQTHGTRIREILDEHSIWKYNGKALLATVIITHPTPSGEMQKNEFTIDLGKI